MTRRLTLLHSLFAATAWALLASTAFAQGGLNLSWDECGSAGVLHKNFACDTNSGEAILYGSAVTGHDMPMFVGALSVIDMQTNVANLSDWWQVNSGGCRYRSPYPPYLQASFDFSAMLTPACANPWVGTAFGALDYAPSFGVPNRARIRTVAAIQLPSNVDGSTEYYFFSVRILYGRTTGLGSCAGCTDGACFVFRSVNVTQPSGVGDYTITNPLARRHVTWQPGGPEIGTLGCPGTIPTRATTWGQVKSMYR